MTAIEVVSLVLAGVLAGEEFVIRWGVQPALRRLDDLSHLRARIALIGVLRYLVPALMVPTVVATVITVIVGGAAHEPGQLLRSLGLIALGAFVFASFLGTVPINIRVNDWDPADPPADWREVVRRWEAIDVVRSSAAMIGFVLLAIATAQR